ncbi:MAG: ABC transporter ATP-binding protein [Polyangiales bacterium]
MARIALQGIAHSYVTSATADRPYALAPLDLTWESGGAYALLGPSGCGKSTLLNIMSGLTRPTHGTITIDGRDVTALAPQARNIAQVFQFPVIYDTMSVFDNLAFPLRNRGVRGVELTRRVERVAELLELGPSLPRRARQLSADLQQRISLGRGLVRTDVAAILLDEPLTVIDPHAKWVLRRKLKQIHAELAVTLVYVTHDQVEALTLADQVLVMNEGRVLQQGTPAALFERPAHTFVGYFIGSPGMNLLACELDDAGVHIDGYTGPSLALQDGLVARARAHAGPYTIGVRPEWLRLTGGRTAYSLHGEVTQVELLGHSSLVSIALGSQRAIVRLSEHAPPSVGDVVWVELDPRWTRLFASGHVVNAVD